MYYYIFENTTVAKDLEKIAQIKEMIATLGIAGEMSVPGPGRGPVDLVNAAVTKRYSTIIAVGGMTLLNSVAKAIEPFDVVLGIIPLIDHPDFVKLIGTSDWKTATNNLKRRRWQTAKLGIINEQFCFLTPATLDFQSDSIFELIADKYNLKGSGGLIVITPSTYRDEEDLQLILESDLSLSVDIIKDRSVKNKGIFAKMFNKQSDISLNSHLDLASFKLTSVNPVYATVAGEVLCQTPITCRVQEKSIKLITCTLSS